MAAAGAAADPSRPLYLSVLSTKLCTGFCAGHYRVRTIDLTDQSALISAASPSTVHKAEFSKLQEYPPRDDFFQQTAKNALLTTDLHTILLNRKRGAQKAATTR